MNNLLKQYYTHSYKKIYGIGNVVLHKKSDLSFLCVWSWQKRNSSWKECQLLKSKAWLRHSQIRAIQLLHDTK